MARILITGCSTGIGRQTAITLTERGHEVVATARRISDVESLVTDHGIAAVLGLDVTNEADVRAAVTATGEIDVVVNNAGWEVAGPIELVPLEDVRRMFEVNWFGVIRMVQAFAPRMRARGHGIFVNVSSVAGRVSGPLNGFYAGSKHAIEALSDSMHYELNHFGIRTIVIEPGAIATNFQSNILHVGDHTAPYDELREQWDAARAILRGGGEAPGPDLVADAIADAIDDALAGGNGPRRIPVGEDANVAIPAWRSMGDDDFESTMRATLGIEW
jgi:NAD(P)-dependent dehydrogenase (short-subunit alcohol dehydrogenase family)